MLLQISPGFQKTSQGVSGCCPQSYRLSKSEAQMGKAVPGEEEDDCATSPMSSQHVYICATKQKGQEIIPCPWEKWPRTAYVLTNFLILQGNIPYIAFHEPFYKRTPKQASWNSDTWDLDISQVPSDWWYLKQLQGHARDSKSVTVKILTPW